MKRETKSERAKLWAELKANPINVFTCGHKDCKQIQFMQKQDFLKHLEDAHSLDRHQWKGKRQMIAHIDGDFWFSYSYEWTLDSGLTFTQYVKLARDNKFYV